MAELPGRIRKPGGDLVPARGPFNRKVLLPAEADLCNILGITKEEYFQFLEDVAAKIKERPKAYDLVPDIRGDLVSLGILTQAGGLAWFGSILVGVALNVAAYLLTDRSQPSLRAARRTADVAGLRRFAPQFGFNSVQDLAVLGDVIPLVFADLNEQDGLGGVRVNSQLLWSQIVSLGRYQQLKILAMFSLGELAEKPLREGYAIGDLLLANYNEEKVLLKGNTIPFVTKGSATSKEKFKIDGKEWFSGTRNPTTQSVFGLTAPAPNCTYFRLPYQVHRAKPRDTWGGKEERDAIRPAARFKLAERRKNLGKWPARAGVIGITKNEERYFGDMYVPPGFSLGDYIYPESATLTSGQITSIKKGEYDIPVGTFVDYQILGGGKVGDSRAYQRDETGIVNNDIGYHGFGVQDVDAISKTMRETTDNIFTQHEQYMIGTALVRCTYGDAVPFDIGVGDKGYQFKVLETGRIECVPNHNLGAHVGNPRWIGRNAGNPATAKKFIVQLGKWAPYFYYGQSEQDLYEPAKTYTVQKAVIGTVSDNRACDITELGIKSKVFKQMNFANVNSKPKEDVLDAIVTETSFALGNIAKYTRRYSFFKVQVKRLGGKTWQTLTPNETGHSGLFCVTGSSIESQYNYIRIEHPSKGQYEYRFLPWPGADVIKVVDASGSIKVNLLDANNATDDTSLCDFTDKNDAGRKVEFAGNDQLTLSYADLSNPEWNLGSGEKDENGVPINFSSTYSYGSRTTPVGFTADSVTHVGNIDTKYEERTTTQWTRYYGTALDGVNRSVEALTVPESGSYSYTTKTYPDTSLIVNGENNTSLILISQAAAGFYHVNCYLNPNHTPPNVEGHGARGLQGWFNNMTINEVTHRPVSALFGGGQTVNGVEFEYTIPNSGGQKGILIPIIDPNIPGAGANGHPGGNTRLYYVRNMAVELTPVDPVINKQVVDLINVDPNSVESGAQAVLTVWRNTSGQTYAEWYYNTEPSGAVSSYKDFEIVKLPARSVTIDGSSVQVFAGHQVELLLADSATHWGITVGPGADVVDSMYLNPYDAASDYWIFNGDKSSHLDGPEHEIVYCNEIVKDTSSTYNDLAYAALSVDSSKEWTNFSRLSAYIKKGIKVERLIGDDGNDAVANTSGVDSEGKGPTHLFPEIAYALLTDEMLGAGAVINANSVNKVDMTIAAKFCKANGFFWDGVISNKFNLREFIFEQATHCLLDFTIIGGIFSLKPSVPYNTTDFTINRNKPIEIKAMFNDGNINELNVAFLSSEDRQTFKAVILYREEEENGFAETKSATVELDGDSHANDPVQTFDLSGFCCSEQHAIIFGRYVISAKLKTSHMITFKTSPNYVQGLKAGDYIRVYSTVQHTDRFRNGAILAGGKVVSKDEITGSQNIYWWNSTKEAVEYQTGVNFDSASALAAYAGSLFTIVENEASDQCYRVESLTFGEDSLIEIAASNVELVGGNKLAILQEWNLADDGSHRFV